jgi:alpha-methylacyl-CoA racemase
MPRPCAGIRVLDLSRLLPGPYLSMILADLGADVVKIEDPRLGDYMRQMPPVKDGGLGGRYLAVNRGKRSMTLDLKTPGGKDAFLRMAGRADVVIDGFRPGVLAKLGVGYETLRARNRGIILCSISGYGQDGPYRDRAGHDLNYIALTGILGMTGARGSAPAMPGAQIADLAGGALWGALTILAALVGRHASGDGAHLDVSMTEGALALMAAEVGTIDCGVRPTRGEATLNGGLACYNVYTAGDGKHLSLGALEPKFWLAFNRAIGRGADVNELVAELVGGPEVQERVRAEIAERLAMRSRDEWLAIFGDDDVCCEPILELDEVPAHPLHVARGAFFAMDGGVLQMRTPAGAPESPRAPPRHGEHTAEVLAEYGFSAAEIAALA